ncbi:MAG: lysylphosphatidylglycerol synthase transmembrane domain-containing protein [Chloroflexota bacterium]
MISAGAIVIVLQSVDIGQTAEALADTRLLVLAPCLVLVAAGIVLRAWRWQRLVVPVADHTPPVRRIAPIVLIGYLANAVLPARLGEPIRAYLLARRESLNAFEVFGTVLLERILDVAVLAVMAFLASLALGAPPWVVQLTGVAAAGGFLIIGVLTLGGLRTVLRFLHRLADHGRFAAARMILTRLDQVAQGFGGRSQRLPVAEAAGLTVVIWLVDTSICWLAARSLGADISLAAALLIIGVGALGTSVPSAPGSIGTFELAASAAARAVGLTAPAALSLAIVVHATTLLPVALAGAIAMFALGLRSLSDLAGAARKSVEPSNGER